MSDITLTSAMRQNLSQLRSTATLLDRTQNRIATGKKVNTSLDDPTAYFKAKGLTDSASDLATLKDDMGQSISTIQAADKAITSITDLVEQAKSLANSAKSSSVAADRSDLAAQFEDIRTQIDQLAADASYSGTNLVGGRGTFTGGAWVVNSATVVAGLSEVSAISSSSQTTEGNFDITVQQLVEQPTVSVTGAVSPTDVTAAVTGLANNDGVTVNVTDNATGTVTSTDILWLTGETFDDIEAKFEALTGIGLATWANNGGLTLDISANYTVQIEDKTNGSTFNTKIGTVMGYQNGVDVTTALDIDGGAGRLNVWAEGYTSVNGTNLNLSIAGTTLTVTDGSYSTTVDTATLFASDSGGEGTLTTLSLGGMTVRLAVTGTLVDGGSMDGESTEVAKGAQTGSAGDYRFQTISNGVTDYETAIASTVISNTSFGGDLTLTVDTPTGLTAGETVTASLTNPTGTGSNDMTVTFNAAGTSTVRVASVDITTDGLSIGVQNGDWATDANVDAAIADIDAAKLALRANSKAMSTSLGIVQTREDFTSNFIDTLRVGADKLTLADGTEEATNMLVLQTRQQLGIQALSIASQSSQSILILFQ